MLKTSISLLTGNLHRKRERRERSVGISIHTFAVCRLSPFEPQPPNSRSRTPGLTPGLQGAGSALRGRAALGCATEGSARPLPCVETLQNLLKIEVKRKMKLWSAVRWA